MPKLLIFLLLLTFCISIYAQTEQTEKPKVISWKETDPNCDEIFIDGMPLRIIKNNGVEVGVIQEDNGDYAIFFVIIRNLTQERFNVDPTQFAFYYSEKDPAKGKLKADDFKMMTPVDPEKVADKIIKKAKWKSFFNGFASAFAKRTTTVDVNGLPVTITEQDRAAQTRAMLANREIKIDAEARAAGVMESALKKNTLFPNEHIEGTVFFKREKFKVCAVYFVVNGVDYEFAYKKK